MNTCSFYSYVDIDKGLNSCSRCDNSRPIVVNCVGCVSTDFAFATDNPAGREDYYLMVITEGELEIANAKRAARAGDVVIFPPKTHYGYTFLGKGHLCYLWAHFTGAYAEQFLRELSFECFPKIHRHGYDSSVLTDFKRIFDAYLKGDTLRDLLVSVQLERILLSLSGACGGDKNDDGSLFRSIAYIHSNYHTDIRIPELAKMENLSVSRYNVIFNKIMGMPPQHYLITLRLQIACDLLGNTDMNVRQIGISVGYDDPHFFSKLFKRYMGVSPIAYRNKHV